MILIKDRHFFPTNDCPELPLGKYDTYKGSTLVSESR